MISFSLQADTGFWKQRGKDQGGLFITAAEKHVEPQMVVRVGTRQNGHAPSYLAYLLSSAHSHPRIHPEDRLFIRNSKHPWEGFLCRWAQMLFLSALKSHPLSGALELPCPLTPCSTSLGLSDSRKPQVEKAMATHSSTLAWKIPWTGEPGGLPSVGSHRVGHD